MYTKCTQNVVYKMYPIFGQAFVHKKYTKCLHTKCIPRFSKRLHIFCIQNLAGIVLLILYTKCIQVC